jgi:hypothetical protein
MPGLNGTLRSRSLDLTEIKRQSMEYLYRKTTDMRREWQQETSEILMNIWIQLNSLDPNTLNYVDTYNALCDEAFSLISSLDEYHLTTEQKVEWSPRFQKLRA